MQPGQYVVGVAHGIVLQVKDEDGEKLRRLDPRLRPPVPEVALEGLPQVVEDPLHDHPAAEAGPGPRHFGVVSGRLGGEVDLLLHPLVP